MQKLNARALKGRPLDLRVRQHFSSSHVENFDAVKQRQASRNKKNRPSKDAYKRKTMTRANREIPDPVWALAIGSSSIIHEIARRTWTGYA